jgi:hypothetical protein
LLLEFPLVAEIVERYSTIIKDSLGLVALTIHAKSDASFNPIAEVIA